MIAWAGLAERSAAGRALWGARGRGPRAVAGLLAPALALAAGCRAPVAHDDEALSVGFSGCAAVTVVLAAGASSPVCQLEAGGAVRLVSERASIARVAPSGQEVALAAGRVTTVTPPLGSTAIEVRAAQRTFRLALAAPDAPSASALEPAIAERRAGRFAEARARVQAVLDARAHPAEDGVRAAATSLLARVHLDAGARDEAVSAFRAAIALHRARGELSAEAHDRFALAWALSRVDRVDEAEAEIAEILPRLDAYPDGAAEAPYYLALASRRRGDVRNALRWLRLAESRADALGNDVLGDQIREELASGVLRDLGRLDEARVAIERVRARRARPACKRATTSLNAAWIAMGAREDAVLARESARAAAASFDEAIALYRGECPSPGPLGTALVDAAEAHLVAGDVAAARERLAASRALPGAPVPVVVALRDELEARIALDEGSPQAARAIGERLLADPRAEPGTRFRAMVLVATALSAEGKTDRALRVFDDADRALSAEIAQVPLGEGRDQLATARDEGARAHVETALRAGRLAEAARVARRSRARVLASFAFAARLGELSLSQRTAVAHEADAYRRESALVEKATAELATLPADELARRKAELGQRRAALRERLDRMLGAAGTGLEAPLAPPEAGEVLLVMHPALRGSWAVLAVSAAETRGGLVAWDGRSVRDAPSVFGDVAASLHAARLVRVLAYGAARTLDVHALLRAQLGVTAPVVYALDVAVPEGPAAAGGPVVVSDPTGDLPAARDEGDEVAAVLGALGTPARSLSGDAATQGAVLEALASTDLLHVAGHGRFGGREGWESALSLADGPLEASRILVAPRVPRVVLLAGCETARDDVRAGTPGIGLAQAFVLAGARAVVATSRPVADGLARGVTVGMLRADPALRDPAAALVAATSALAESDPQRDVSAFRVVVP